MSDDTINQWDVYALQDCIKSLTKERDYWKEAYTSQLDAESKLAKAVEGLHDLAKDFSKPDAGLTDFGERQHYLFLACRLRDKARTTLAELKGHDDE